MRTADVYVVVDRHGWPLLWTAAWRRRDAVTKYMLHSECWPWRKARRVEGVRVERCVLCKEGAEA